MQWVVYDETNESFNSIIKEYNKLKNKKEYKNNQDWVVYNETNESYNSIIREYNKVEKKRVQD